MRTLRALALYAVLTVALTWPFAANLRVMDAGDSAFFAWEIGWTVHALKTDPAQPAAREHLPPAALHARDGRAGARHDAPGAAARALHGRRGAALQRGPAADVRALGADGLLAGARAGRGRADRARSRARSSRSRRSAPTRSPTSRRSGRSGGRSCCCSRSASRSGAGPGTRSWRRSSSCSRSWPAATTA